MFHFDSYTFLLSLDKSFKWTIDNPRKCLKLDSKNKPSPIFNQIADPRLFGYLIKNGSNPIPINFPFETDIQGMCRFSLSFNKFPIGYYSHFTWEDDSIYGGSFQEIEDWWTF